MPGIRLPQRIGTVLYVPEHDSRWLTSGDLWVDHVLGDNRDASTPGMQVRTALLAAFLLTAGCNTTYNAGSSLSPNADLPSYRYLLVPMHDDSTRDREPSDSTRFGVETVISGAALKCGLAVVSDADLTDLSRDDRERVLIASWGVSGRTTRFSLFQTTLYGIPLPLPREGYSQEVSITLSDNTSKQWIYRGVGEYMGRTELDDIKGALTAALDGLC